jgi:hypothetical protein
MPPVAPLKMIDNLIAEWEVLFQRSKKLDFDQSKNVNAVRGMLKVGHDLAKLKSQVAGADNVEDFDASRLSDLAKQIEEKTGKKIMMAIEENAAP